MKPKIIDTHLRTKTSPAVAVGAVFLILTALATLPIMIGLTTALFAISLVRVSP